MSNLYFDREKQNIGGLNEFSFILESSLNAAIEIIKGQATTFDISTDFIVPRLVTGSIKFAESKRNVNLFEYNVSARVAQDDYEKLQDCIMFDTNRIIAIVKDNNGHRRLLGQLNNACELTINFDKGTQTADLNHYAIELRWTSKYRAAFVAATYVVPKTMAAEDGTLISYESAIDGNKLSAKEIAATIADGYVYIILPDNLNPGKYLSYRVLLINFIEAPLGFTPENVANKENTTLDTSATKYPTNRLVKEFVENLVTGLWDDRGNYDASGNVYPSSGGSGTAGAILKGDIWTISIGGDLNNVPVQAGDTVRALQDTPGQTAGNWAVGDTNIGYTPENAINKRTSFQTTPTDTAYPSEKLVKDSLDAKLGDATSDGKTYGRKDAAWSEIVAAGDITKVGTGQTYTTLGAAVTAGKKLIEIISNTTETGNITLISGIKIFSLAGRDAYTINMGAFYFGSCEDVDFDGVSITFAHSTAVALFNTTYTYGNANLNCNNVKFTNNSTINGAAISFIGNFTNCKVILPNYAGCGFGNGSTYNFDGDLDTIEFVGAGLNTNAIIQNTSTTNENHIFRNLRFSGTFNFVETIKVVSVDGILSYVPIGVGIYKSASNIKWYDTNASEINLRLDSASGVKVNIINCDVNSVSFQTYCFASFIGCFIYGTFNSFANVNGAQFVNCEMYQSVDFDYPYIKVINCRFVVNVTISGNYITILSSFINGTLTVSTGDNNMIQSNVVGVSNTAYTITFNSGANNSICVGNQTNAAIVNNGTGNQLAYNVVF